MHTKERRDRCVDARHLHRDETIEQWASATATVTLKSDTSDVQLGELRQQFKRKGIFNPVLVDDGRDFFLQKRAQLVQRRELLRIQKFGDLVKVAVWSRELLRLPKFLSGRLHYCACHGHGLLLVLLGLNYWFNGANSSGRRSTRTARRQQGTSRKRA